MKKLLCLLLAVLLLVCLCACGEKPVDNDADGDAIPSAGDTTTTTGDTTTTTGDTTTTTTTTTGDTTTTTTTSTVQGDMEKILGTWQTTLDISEAMNEGFSASMGDMAPFFVATDLTLTLSQTFKADGTFETFIAEDDLEAYFDAIKALIRDGLVAYFEDMLVQSALDMTVDELLALSGTDMDTMLDETFAAMDFDSMADAFKASGKYALEDGKMYSAASNESIDKSVYETYTLTEDTLTLHAIFGQAADGVTYPMVFTRVTE